MDPEGARESTLMELEVEMVKRLDRSNGRNKTAAIATAASQTWLDLAAASRQLDSS